jgi:DNA adenine methylase
MKPVLKWAGGKARLAPRICAAFTGPCAGVYLEPFAGAAAVALYRLQRNEISHAVLTDVNAKLIAVHQAIRDHVDLVLEALDALPDDDWRERYYEVRAAFNAGPFKGPEHAARFLWLNRAGFNGLYRENKKGQFNVPIGRYKRVSLPSEDHFLAMSELLQGVELKATDFRSALKRAGRGDQVYCDPPYVPLSATANFTAYCKAPFGLNEQIALADSAREAAVRGAEVVLSNHDVPLVRDRIYKVDDGFRYVGTPRVARAISRKGSNRKAVSEVIAAIGPAAA